MLPESSDKKTTEKQIRSCQTDAAYVVRHHAVNATLVISWMYGSQSSRLMDPKELKKIVVPKQ